MMDYGTPSSCLDSSITSEEKKNHCSMFKIEIKVHFYSLKTRMMHCLIIREKTAFVLSPLRTMINSEV